MTLDYILALVALLISVLSIGFSIAAMRRQDAAIREEEAHRRANPQKRK